MKDKWEKGDPVSLSDLLKITPVANEIMRLSEELQLKYSDIIWIISEIIRDCEHEGIHGKTSSQVDLEFDSEEDPEMYEEEWDGEDEREESYYFVNLKINSHGKFPEVSFKAGINEKEDLHGFLNMIIDIMGKIDL
ncbi:MAG: hypothetical protein ACM3MK_08035 [Chitinophagales bacterium]